MGQEPIWPNGINFDDIVVEDMPSQKDSLVVIVPGHIGVADVPGLMDYIAKKADEKIILVVGNNHGLSATMAIVTPNNVELLNTLKKREETIVHIKNIEFPEVVACADVNVNKKFYDHFYDHSKKRRHKRKR